MSAFGYCLLVWANHSRTQNNRINVLHKRAFSLVYNDFSSSFSELLEKDKSVTIHHRHFQTLAYEIFKVKNNMALEILTETFPQKESNYILEIAQRCSVEILKLSCIVQKLYLALNQKYGTFYRRNFKKIVSHPLFK